jgi:predicted SprT family Zn-dependent metalloprotease
MKRQDSVTVELSSELLRIYVRELLAEWHLQNSQRFRSRLTPPVLSLSAGHTHLGRYHHATRSLELSRAMLETAAWGDIVEVLKHEMAHQYVHEALGVHDEVAHGVTFRAVCRELGIDGRASGTVNPRTADEERLVSRVAKLLALAGSSNAHEAEAAMLAAQRLMARHNIQPSSSLDASCTYSYRQLGTPTGRVYEPMRLLASILASHFFVDAIWVSALRKNDGKRGSVLEICGKPANLDLAEYVYGFLRATSERLYEDHKAAHPHAVHHTVQQPAFGTREASSKRAFLAGVMTGFAKKLKKEQRKVEQEGLVWVKDSALADYFQRRHPRVRHVRFAERGRGDAYRRGEDAGSRIVLHRAMHTANGDGAPRLLLPKL